MGKLDAIILAGGLGTRLREVVSDVPKVLAPVNGKPFLDIILESLENSGCVDRAIITVGYMADKVIERYGNWEKYGFDILFSEERELLGTGGAIKKALQLVETDDVLALNGDSYVDINIKDMLSAHKEKQADFTMAVREVADASRYGSIVLGNDNKIVFFEEKKPRAAEGYINAGVYLFKRKLFEKVKSEKVISLERDLLPVFLKGGMYGYKCTGKFIDIGIPETYKISSNYLQEGS